MKLKPKMWIHCIFICLIGYASYSESLFTGGWNVKSVKFHTLRKVDRTVEDEDLISKMKRLYFANPYYGSDDYVEFSRIYYAENLSDRIFLFNIGVFDVQVAYVVDCQGNIIDQFLWSAWGQIERSPSDAEEGAEEKGAE